MLCKQTQCRSTEKNVYLGTRDVYTLRYNENGGVKENEIGEWRNTCADMNSGYKLLCGKSEYSRKSHFVTRCVMKGMR